MRWIAFIILCVSALAPTGCRRAGNSPRSGELLSRAGQPTVAYVPEDDPRLTQATLEARKTLLAFAKELERPRPTQSHFAVKTTVRERAGLTEAVWLTGLSFDGKAFHGGVANEPVHLKNTHLGSKVSVPVGEVSDWMFVEDGRLHGGYTVRVLREVLVGDARVQFDQAMPYSFD